MVYFRETCETLEDALKTEVCFEFFDDLVLYLIYKYHDDDILIKYYCRDCRCNIGDTFLVVISDIVVGFAYLKNIDNEGDYYVR